MKGELNDTPTKSKFLQKIQNQKNQKLHNHKPSEPSKQKEFSTKSFEDKREEDRSVNLKKWDNIELEDICNLQADLQELQTLISVIMPSYNEDYNRNFIKKNVQEMTGLIEEIQTQRLDIGQKKVDILRLMSKMPPIKNYKKQNLRLDFSISNEGYISELIDELDKIIQSKAMNDFNQSIGEMMNEKLISTNSIGTARGT